MNIVLIDDTPEHLDLLAEFIQELRPGARISRLQDGLELPQRLEQQPADLVLMDLIMPSINGFDLVRKIREWGPWKGLPIVAVSGLRQENHLQELSQAGFSDFIVKPYEIEDLTRILDQHLPG